MPLITEFAGIGLTNYGFSRGGVAGTFELISTAYGTGSNTSVSFTSIPNTYKHLQVRMIAKNSYTAGSTWAGIRLNNISTAQYNWHSLTGNGSTVTSANEATSVMKIGDIGGNDVTSAHSVAIVDILDYTNTSKFTTIRALSGSHGSAWKLINLTSGVWRDVSAVTQLDILLAGYTIDSTSRFSLYGIRG